MGKWWLLPLMETEMVQLPDPAEPRTQQQLRPSTSADIKNTSVYWFLASRQASSSLHQGSSNQQQVLHKGKIHCFADQWSLVSAWDHRPEWYCQHNLNVLVTQTSGLHGCADCRRQPMDSPDWPRKGYSSREIHTNPHCVAGVLSLLKHKVILPTGTRIFCGHDLSAKACAAWVGFRAVDKCFG